MFTITNILSFSKIPYLGPLQISLGRMLKVNSESAHLMFNMLSFSRISYLLPANEYLEPLQISLGRMLKVNSENAHFNVRQHFQFLSNFIYRTLQANEYLSPLQISFRRMLKVDSENANFTSLIVDVILVDYRHIHG